MRGGGTEYGQRMQIAARYRWVAAWQWVFAIVLPAFVLVGRRLLGAELGWMAVIGIVVYALPTVLALLLPPVLTRFDRQARAAHTVRRTYAIAGFVMWGSLVLAGLSIPDSGDNGELPSVLARWFGLSHQASTVVFSVALMAAVIAWAITLAVAVSGIALSRKPA